MRQLTDHIVPGTMNDSAVRIEVVDEPGSGGANHEYLIRVNGPINTSVSLIKFQNGPIKEAGFNGITDEALIAILLDRLRGFQSGKYKCKENACALTHFEGGLMWLQERTRKRLARGVEGTHAI